MKKTKLGEELPKISRACVNNANSLPSLYNKACSEREIINKHAKTKVCILPLHKQLLIKILLRPQRPVNRLVNRRGGLEHIVI